MSIEDLSKNELLRFIRAYDKYIIDFFENRVDNSMIPICANEYFNNEYNMYLEVGDIVCFGRFVEDEDLNEWLSNNAQNGILRYRVVEIEDDRFYIENCPYSILLNENWILNNIENELEYDDTENEYLRKKFIQEFRVDRVIDEIMDCCNNKELNNLIRTKFKENVDLEEFREIFEDLDDEEFIDFMNETLDFDFEDIDDYNKRI